MPSHAIPYYFISAQKCAISPAQRRCRGHIVNPSHSALTRTIPSALVPSHVILCHHLPSPSIPRQPVPFHANWCLPVPSRTISLAHRFQNYHFLGSTPLPRPQRQSTPFCPNSHFALFQAHLSRSILPLLAPSNAIQRYPTPSAYPWRRIGLHGDYPQLCDFID